MIKVTQSSATLSWNPPLFDGQGEITGYVIEYLKVIDESNEDDEDWIKYSAAVEQNIHTQIITGLSESCEYKFR